MSDMYDAAMEIAAPLRQIADAEDRLDLSLKVRFALALAPVFLGRTELLSAAFLKPDVLMFHVRRLWDVADAATAGAIERGGPEEPASPPENSQDSPGGIDLSKP